MQPFEKADEEIRRKGTQPHRIASSVLGTVTSVGAGIAASKVLPFLSQYIPQSLAIKGLSKIDPRLGAFATKALDEGESFDSVKNFIKDKLTKSESKQNNEEKNIIKKYSPELDKFIQQGVAAGKDIGEIAHAARKKDMKTADKISKDTKKVWLDLVEEIYGMPVKNKKQEKVSPENAQNGQNTTQNSPNNGQKQGTTDWAAKAKMFKDFIDNA